MKRYLVVLLALSMVFATMASAHAGKPVSAAVGQDPEGDGTVTTTDFCTSTEEPLPIEPGLEVVVFVFVGPCTSPPGPAFATQGTVTVTLSNMP